ncbi:MAG: efflux RND transporter periplasmic adaptor subunit [Polyangiaceae bacterium]
MSDQLSSDLASLRIDRAPAKRGGSAWRTWLVVLAIFGGVGAAGVAAYPTARANIFKTEVAFTEVTTLSPVEAQVQVTATGYIVPQLVTKVGAHDIGRIQRVLVKEGDTVKAGQVLAIFDTIDQKSAVLAATSRVAVAQARVATAQANLAEIDQKVAREKPLVANGAENRAVLDDLVAQERSLDEQVKAAQADVTASQAERSTLDVTLAQRTLIAPMDGTVVSKPREPGEVATPGDPTPIVELVDFRSLLAEVDVPENRLGAIKIGGPAEITLDAYPDRPYRGRVAELGKRVDRAKGTLVVKVKFESVGLSAAAGGVGGDGGVDDAGTDDGPPDGVVPEMSARVSFLSAPVSDEALKAVPKRVVLADALVDRAGKKVVFVVDNSEVRAVPVTVGSPNGSSIELIDGPAVGTRVVSAPPPELVTGMKVKEKGT